MSSTSLASKDSPEQDQEIDLTNKVRSMGLSIATVPAVHGHLRDGLRRGDVASLNKLLPCRTATRERSSGRSA